jgi:hypothetical protein
MVFRGGGLATVYKCFENGPKSTWLRQHPAPSQILEVRHISIFNIQFLCRALFNELLCPDDIRLFNPRAMLFDLQ